MQAAVARLMVDDTAHASQLLWRIRAAGGGDAANKAAAMLKALEPVEPAARMELMVKPGVRIRFPMEP
jgi:hypothetical protein